MNLSERLKYARERAGLTLSQVRERTDLGESSLSEFENGKREPRLAQLQALSSLYRRSISFFLGEGPVAHEVVLWRKKPEPQVATAIEAQFLELCEQYHNLEVWCADHRPNLLPVVTRNGEVFGYAEAERLAYRVQSELRLGDHPGQSLGAVLEEVCGVKLFYLSFEPSGTAASSVSESFGPAVLLNAANARWRRNFDLAHELFHLLTWQVFRTGGQVAVASEKEEKLATCFASQLLMPADATRVAINDVVQNGSLTFSALASISRQFDVSVEALLWRMHFLYHRKEVETKRDIARHGKLASMFESREQDHPPKRPARFVALAVKAFRGGEISQGRLAHYLGISRKEASKFAQSGAAGDEEKVTVPPA